MTDLSFDEIVHNQARSIDKLRERGELKYLGEKVKELEAQIQELVWQQQRLYTRMEKALEVGEELFEETRKKGIPGIVRDLLQTKKRGTS